MHLASLPHLGKKPDERQIVSQETLRLTTPLAAFGPLLLGIGIAVLGRLLIDLEIFSDLRQRLLGRAELALLWVAPVLIGALLSSAGTLWLELNPSGVRVRRMLGKTRSYETGEVVSWGFEYSRDAISSLPPTDARQWVRFRLQTADGFGFRKSIDGKKAQHLSKLLIARCTPT